MVQLKDEKHSILIVDDDRSYRSILSNVFARSDYRVSTAEDGQAALQLMESLPYDLVITDLQMPNVDGVALIQTLQNRFPQTRVIVMSAYADEDRYRSFLSNLSCRCLPKPFRRLDVLEMASQMLQDGPANAVEE
ncbi:MAG: response regulator [bacterium]|nr:response regulator [bacterium]